MRADFKGLVESVISFGVLHIVSYIFPLVTIPYLSKTIGVDRFGDLALATAIVMYFQVLVDWGYNLFGVREIARNREDLGAISKIYSEVFWGRGVLLLISLCLITLLILIVPRFQSIAIPIYFRFLVIIGYWLYADWFFQGIEQMRYITILNILSGLFSVLGTFIIIKSPEDYIYQPLLMSLGFLITGCVSFFVLIPKKGVKLTFISARAISLSLKNSIDIFLNQSVIIYFENLLILILGVSHPSKDSGIFEAGNKPSNVILRLSNILSRAFYPLLSRKLEYHRLFSVLSLSLSIILSSVVFISAPYIINVLYPAQGFEEAIIVLRILSIGLVFSVVISIYGTNYLLPLGQEKMLRRITIRTSLISLAIGTVLIQFYSWSGIASAFLMSKVLMAFAIIHCTRRVKNEYNQSKC